MSRSKKISLGFQVVDTRTGERLSAVFAKREPAREALMAIVGAHGRDQPQVGDVEYRGGKWYRALGVEHLEDYISEEDYRARVATKKASKGHALRRRYGHARAVKEPAYMTNAQINAELKKLSALSSKLNQRFIDAGRGNETAWETVEMTDPLALEYRALWSRRRDLNDEGARRYGPGYREGWLERGGARKQGDE